VAEDALAERDAEERFDGPREEQSLAARDAEERRRLSSKEPRRAEERRAVEEATRQHHAEELHPEAARGGREVGPLGEIRPVEEQPPSNGLRERVALDEEDVRGCNREREAESERRAASREACDERAHGAAGAWQREEEEEREADEDRLVFVERGDPCERARGDVPGGGDPWSVAIEPRSAQHTHHAEHGRKVHQELTVHGERIGGDAGRARERVEQGRDGGEARLEGLARDGVERDAREDDEEDPRGVHPGHDGAERAADVRDERAHRAVRVREPRRLVVDRLPVHRAAAHDDLRHRVVDGLVVRDERVAERGEPKAHGDGDGQRERKRAWDRTVRTRAIWPGHDGSPLPHRTSDRESMHMAMRRIPTRAPTCARPRGGR
jgi:hypothetical protein